MATKIPLLNIPAFDVAAQLETIRSVMYAEYTKRHKDPWIFAFSGGKDSTLLLHLAYEVILSIEPSLRTRPLYIVANDTLVESPLVINHLNKSLHEIREGARRHNLPVIIEKTKPNIDETFWVNVIGRGYIPPTRNFRWCTDRMKIKPTKYILDRVLLRHKRAVLLIGTRRAESQNRQRNMDKRKVRPDAMHPHEQIQGCRVFVPLADLVDSDVWSILLQLRPPWGGTHKRLITLYKSAGGGECPLVLTKNDAPSCGTSSPRFGCWTCTVVEKDKSLRGLIDAGHKDEAKFEELARFRDRLIALREDNRNRQPTRRDGTTKIRGNGNRVYGPFTLKIRKKILEELLALSDSLGDRLITQTEIEVIEEIWRTDQIRETSRQALLDDAIASHA